MEIVIRMITRLQASAAGIIILALLSSCGGDRISEVSLIPLKDGNEFQYVDKEGKIIINPQFSEATVFRDGLALVRTSGDERLWGYISEDGKYALKPIYKAATVFSEGLAWVVAENSAPAAIDEKGQTKLTLSNAEAVKIFSQGLAAFSMTDSAGNRWGFIDQKGVVQVNPQFQQTGNFSGGLCAVQNSDKEWGYINAEGELRISYQFSEAGPFINGRAVVEFDNKAGVIDESGKYRINPQYKEILNDGDRFLFRQDGKYGWSDPEGKILINPQFSKALPFAGNNLAPVESGKNWGYVDRDGKFMINPQFDAALPYNGKVALVMNGKKIGLIDAEGRFAVNPQFESVSTDFVQQITRGGSSYEMVLTDFFNIDAIVKRINFAAPEGLSLTDKLSAVNTRLGIGPNAYRQYSLQHEIISNERVSSDAEIDFSVVAKAYAEVPAAYSMQYVFNPDAEVQGFIYSIRLKGRGYGKEKDVMLALDKALAGFVNDQTHSTENDLIYVSERTQVNIILRNSRVTISIIPYNDDTAGDI